MFLKKISKNIAVALTLVMVSGPALNTVSATNIPDENNLSNVNIESRYNTGSNTYFSVDGIQHRAYALADNSGGRHYSHAYLRADKARPRGTMAVNASVYTTGGVLVHATGWRYNDMVTSSHSTMTNYVLPAGQIYAAGGYARGIDKYGKYHDYKLNRANTPRNTISEKEQKERATLYEEFKMIPSKATNGKVGYIYEDELLGEAPKSPEEAIMIQESRSADDFRMIPVYDKDAKTIIGQFCIEG